MRVVKESPTHAMERAQWARHCKDGKKQQRKEMHEAGIQEYLLIVKYWDASCKSMLGDSMGDWQMKNYWVLARDEEEAKTALVCNNPELVNFPDRELVSISEWRPAKK